MFSNFDLSRSYKVKDYLLFREKEAKSFKALSPEISRKLCQRVDTDDFSPLSKNLICYHKVKPFCYPNGYVQSSKSQILRTCEQNRFVPTPLERFARSLVEFSPTSRLLLHPLLKVFRGVGRFFKKAPHFFTLYLLTAKAQFI